MPQQPTPFDAFYGDPVSTTCDWIGTFAGEYERELTEVLAYESVTVPYGTFSDAMKFQDTTFDMYGPFFDCIVWADPSVGGEP